MPRRNRVPYPVWEQMWQSFCPWVTGTEGTRPESKAKARRRARDQSRKKLLAVGIASLMGLSLLHAPVEAADDASYMTISLNKSAETPRDHYPSLFRAGETRYTDMAPFTKWSGVLERFAKQFNASANDKTTRHWLTFLDQSRDLSAGDQIDAVNAYMNKVTFISDQDNYKKGDYWATPMQFLKRGGDCEDYAIAKYVSLRALGFKEDQMRIAIVFDTQLNMPHAVLIVYRNDKALVLDNQSPDVKQTAGVKQYLPIYSINQLAWWRH